MDRLSYRAAATRAVRLRCPRCGQGPLFRGPFAMHSNCAECGFAFERGPGFYLGSTYVNYGYTAVSLTLGYLILHYGAGWTNRQLAVPLVAYAILVPLILFRHARAWWLALDCWLDATGFRGEMDTSDDEPDRSAAKLGNSGRS